MYCPLRTEKERTTSRNSPRCNSVLHCSVELLQHGRIIQCCQWHLELPWAVVPVAARSGNSGLFWRRKTHREIFASIYSSRRVGFLLPWSNWFHFVSLYIRLYVLIAAVKFCKLCVFVVMFMYSYCYVCFVLCILFECVILCIFCVNVSCAVLLPPGVNPIGINKTYHIIYHIIISCHIISYRIYHIISYLTNPLNHFTFTT